MVLIQFTVFRCILEGVTNVPVLLTTLAKILTDMQLKIKIGIVNNITSHGLKSITRRRLIFCFKFTYIYTPNIIL